MAWQPCLRCGQRFAGEAQNAYLSIYHGDEGESYRFVVCVECLDQVAAEWRMRALTRGADGEWEYHEPTEQPKPTLRPLDRATGPLKLGRRPGRAG